MPWTFKEMIKSIFKKTRADIASEKRQRVEADNNIMQQLNNAVNNGLANKVDKLSEDEITVSNAKNNESHNLTLNNNIAMLSYKDSLNNESQVVVSTTGVKLKDKSNINNNVTVSSTKSEVSHTDKVLLKAGDNVLQVDATDGLQISTDGGSTWGAVGKDYYSHNIVMRVNYNTKLIFGFTIVCDVDTMFNYNKLASWLYSHMYRGQSNATGCIPCITFSGGFGGTNSDKVYGIFATSTSQLNFYYWYDTQSYIKDDGLNSSGLSISDRMHKL